MAFPRLALSAAKFQALGGFGVWDFDVCWFATLLLQLPDGGSKNIRVGLTELNFPGFGQLLPHLQVSEGLAWGSPCPCGDGMWQRAWARSRTLGVESWLPAWFLPSAKYHVADPGERRQSLLLLKYF